MTTAKSICIYQRKDKFVLDDLLPDVRTHLLVYVLAIERKIFDALCPCCILPQFDLSDLDLVVHTEFVDACRDALSLDVFIIF
jgi:hypothetical protein